MLQHNDALVTTSSTSNREVRGAGYASKPIPPIVPVRSSAWERINYTLRLPGGHVLYLYGDHPGISEVEQAVSQFNQLLTLRENWDSYGARPLKSEALFPAIELLVELFAEGVSIPNISMTNFGGVHFEWSRGDGSVEVTIESEAEQNAYAVDEAGVVITVRLTPKEIARLVTQQA
jgi:hypothetical protein